MRNGRRYQKPDWCSLVRTVYGLRYEAYGFECEACRLECPGLLCKPIIVYKIDREHGLQIFSLVMPLSGREVYFSLGEKVPRRGDEGGFYQKPEDRGQEEFAALL